MERIRNSRTHRNSPCNRTLPREKQMPGNRCMLDAPGIYSGWPGFPITLPLRGRTGHQAEGRRDRRWIVEAEEKEKGAKVAEGEAKESDSPGFHAMCFKRGPVVFLRARNRKLNKSARLSCWCASLSFSLCVSVRFTLSERCNAVEINWRKTENGSLLLHRGKRI